MSIYPAIARVNGTPRFAESFKQAAEKDLVLGQKRQPKRQLITLPKCYPNGYAQNNYYYLIVGKRP